MLPKRLSLRIAAAGLMLLGALGGCSDYLSRRDTLTLETGEAVQANIAKQVIDPWPRHARRANRDIDGARLQAGIERYRSPQTSGNGNFNGGSGAPSGLSSAPLGGSGLVR